MAIFELSSKKYKNGRRPFTATLYELQPPDCVVDDVGTKYNKNGITFLEEYAEKNLGSIEDMSVRVEFANEERTEILGHGMTGTSDGMPVFENATVVGHFTNGYIADVDLDGETKRCVCGKGYFDEMCYPAFVSALEEHLANGDSVNGSIEIYRTENNDAIVYKKGYLPEGRIPVEYIHSGWDMVLNPADNSSTLLELNEKKNKEEHVGMEFNMDELKSAIQSTIKELNDKEAAFNSQISELNESVCKKDKEISEREEEITNLNASIEKIKKALSDMEAEREAWYEEREMLTKELARLKVEKRLSEMDEVLSAYTEEEKKYAEVEINSFKEDPEHGDLNAITSKICVGIVTKQKSDAKIAEQNSDQHLDVVDIFSEVYSGTQNDLGDGSIF